MRRPTYNQQANAIDDAISEYGVAAIVRGNMALHPEPFHCPKCGQVASDDWSQCQGECPLPFSPHFKVI